MAELRTPRRRRLRPGLTDAIILSALLGFAALAVVARRKVPSWPLVAAADAGAAGLYAIAVRVSGRLGSRSAAALVRVATVCGALAYLFSAAAPLQHVLHAGWLDARLIAIEQAAFGVQPTTWLQAITTPWLTEWMMFAYVAYLALYPAVCTTLWRRGGEPLLEPALAALTVANVACDVGFVVLPVAGPMAFMGDTYTVPLAGWAFTTLGELIRTKLHYVGGSLPSPHCAAATVLWLAAWRGARGLAIALVPLVLTLLVATVYCRFHYASDAVSGVAVGFMALYVVKVCNSAAGAT